MNNLPKLDYLDNLISPDLVKDLRFALGKRLERIGDLGQFPGAGSFQRGLLFLKARVLIHVYAQAKRDDATGLGDSNQLVERR